jgi:hypothetical protein
VRCRRGIVGLPAGKHSKMGLARTGPIGLVFAAALVANLLAVVPAPPVHGLWSR